MLLGFKPRFRDPILIGTKVFTMRNKRKHEVKIGETLYMYTGLRTSNCMKISDKEKVISKQKVRLTIIAEPNIILLKIYVDGRKLTEKEISEFVKFDGFTGQVDFVEYWIKSSTGKPRKKSGYYRIGGWLDLYHWTDLKY